MSNNQQEVQVYQYNLNIISVTMKIKFPCKMHIQFNNSTLTTEVSPSSANKFNFNQQVTLQQDPDKQHFQLVVHLTTDKGAKYVGGVVKLLHSELMKSQGQRLNVPLIKCLDNDACCELRVDQVSTSRVIVKTNKTKNKLLGSEYHGQGKVRSPIGKSQQFGNVGGAKSQFYFPLTNTNNRKNQWDRKSRQMPQLSYIPKRKSPSKIYQGKDMNNFDGQVSFQGAPTNLLQAEVYKQGYQKLKEKYKKQVQVAKTQLNKRIQLQNNQNNYKLDIMRLKLKTQEQQKSLTQKAGKVNQLQNQLVSLQKKELDLNYLKQQSINKDHQIKLLQDTVKTLQKDNNELKLLNNSRFTSDHEKISILKEEIYQLKLKFEQRQAELNRQIKLKSQLITRKEQDIIAKNQLLERERYSVEDLERASQNKIFEFEKILQNQRSVLNQKINDEKEKKNKVQNQKSKFEDKTKQLNSELQKSKLHINKIDYDKKILTQSSQSLRSQLQQFKAFKEKHTELSRQFKFLSDDKNHLQKQLQKTIQSKDVNLGELSKQHNSQLQYYKKINKQIEQKNKLQSSKVIELQSQLQMTKNQLQKAKRNLLSAEKQMNESKNKQKELRQSNKSKDDQILAFQNQLSASGQNFKNGEQSIKFQLEKTREELQKIKNQLQSQKLRNSQLTDNNSNLTNDVSKLKMKCQFLEQKAEKQQSNLIDKVTNLQTQTKDNQNQINSLQANTSSLKQNEKQLLQKLKNYELGNISTSETIQKLKKQIKILQQRHKNSETQVKTKNTDINRLSNTKENLQKKIQQKEGQNTSLKSEINKLLGEKNKNQKIIQMLQTDLNKAKQQNSEKARNIVQKQTKEQQVRDQIKKNKQEFTKFEMKFNSQKKEYEKFKQNLIENISNSFAQLPAIQTLPLSSTQIGTRRTTSQNQQNSKLNTSALLNRSMDNNNSEIISLVVSNTKDVKISLNKLIEQNKQLMRENQRLGQDVNSTTKKASNNEQGLSRQIQQLQEQLATVYSSKQQQAIKSEDQVFRLNSRLRQKQSNLKDLIMQIQQLEFTLSNIKLDLQATQEEYFKKQSALKRQIIELKDQIEYQMGQINNLQDHIDKIEQQLFTTSAEVQTERDNLSKKQYKVQQLLQNRQKLEAQIDQLKRIKKQLIERVSELQMMLHSEKQLKQKHLALLEEEQNKNRELKVFIDNLMKQKQGAIKSELQKSENIINLQSNLIQMQRDRDVVKQQNQKNKKILEQLKEQIKKHNKTIKDLQSQFSEQKAFNNRTSQKLKEKQKELIIKSEQLVKLEQKYKKTTQKTSKQLGQLQQQMDQKYTSHLISQKQNNQKILNLQKQVNRLQATVQRLKSQVTQYEQFVFAGKQKNQQLTEANKVHEQEITQLKQKVQLLDQSNNDVSQQVREKQQTLFQLSGKIYNLEMKLQAKQAEKNQKLQSLNTQWSIKYDSMCDQFEQRSELLEREKQFASQRIQQKDAELKKLLAEARLSQSDGQNIKQAYSQKIKTLQQDRLLTVTLKNNQLQRLTQQSKQTHLRLQQSQTQHRKQSRQLSITQATLTKLDLKAKQAQQKIKSITKAYQVQLQQLKKKQATYKAFRQGLINTVWKAERQVRKTVQYFVKNLLTVTDERNSKAVLELTKTLENNVVNAMAVRVQERERQMEKGD